jgi:hypothetical protein
VSRPAGAAIVPAVGVPLYEASFSKLFWLLATHDRRMRRDDPRPLFKQEDA